MRILWFLGAQNYYNISSTLPSTSCSHNPGHRSESLVRRRGPPRRTPLGWWPARSRARGAALLAGRSGPGGSWHSDHRRRKRAREEEHVKLSTRSKLLTLRSVSYVAHTLGQILMRHNDSTGRARRGLCGPCASARRAQGPSPPPLPKAPWFLNTIHTLPFVTISLCSFVVKLKRNISHQLP